MHAHAQPGALVFRGECYGPHASHKILPTRRGCKPLPAPNRELAVTAADSPPAKMAKNVQDEVLRPRDVHTREGFKVLSARMCAALHVDIRHQPKAEVRPTVSDRSLSSACRRFTGAASGTQGGGRGLGCAELAFRDASAKGAAISLRCSGVCVTCQDDATSRMHDALSPRHL